MEPVTEIGVLRPFRHNRVEDVAVRDHLPWARIRQARTWDPRSPAWLKLRFNNSP